MASLPPRMKPAATLLERSPPSEDWSRRHGDPLLVRARQTRDLLRAHAGGSSAHLQQRPPPVHTVRVVPTNGLQMASFTSVRPVPVQMWHKVRPVPVQMWEG